MKYEVDCVCVCVWGGSILPFCVQTALKPCRASMVNDHQLDVRDSLHKIQNTIGDLELGKGGTDPLFVPLLGAG